MSFSSSSTILLLLLLLLGDISQQNSSLVFRFFADHAAKTHFRAKPSFRRCHYTDWRHFPANSCLVFRFLPITPQKLILEQNLASEGAIILKSYPKCSSFAPPLLVKLGSEFLSFSSSSTILLLLLLLLGDISQQNSSLVFRFLSITPQKLILEQNLASEGAIILKSYPKCSSFAPHLLVKLGSEFCPYHL